MPGHKEAKTKRIEVRFGHQRFQKCEHARKFAIAPTDTANETYDRIRNAFQPHVGDSEIKVFDRHTREKVSHEYHGLAHGGIYQMGMGLLRTHGIRHFDAATEQIRSAVDRTMTHWAIEDSPYHILPSSLAPPAPAPKDAAEGDQSIQDPYLWSKKFALALKALSVKTQGRHEEVLQHLEAAVEERLGRVGLDAPPELCARFLKTEDVVTVLQKYKQLRREAEEREPEGEQHVLQHTLAFRPRVQGIQR